MTTTPQIPVLDERTQASEDRARSRRAVLPIGVITAVVACGLSVLRSDSIKEFASVVPVVVLVAALLYVVVVPRALRHPSAGGRALGFGLAAVVLVVPAFWSGLPLLFGTSAALIGYAGKRATTGSARSAVGLVLGLLAVVAIVVLYSVDWVSHPGASWWQH